MRSFLFLLALCLAACSAGNSPTTPQYIPSGYPEHLSDWAVFSIQDNTLVLNEGAHPYDLATPLFSDYASKLRTITLPPGEPAIYSDSDVFSFPVGTIITKTFYYSVDMNGAVRQSGAAQLSDNTLPLDSMRMMETRVLAHREDGWVAIPYVWNDEQTEAIVKRTGDIKPLTLVRDDGEHEDFAYLVPNQNQCAGCHAPNNTTRALSPIGPKARHLNKTSAFHEDYNQLDWWRAMGLLAASDKQTRNAPKNAVWTDETFSVDARARAYLDANCGHCHNAKGPADTSGLDLEPGAAAGALGTCKPPIAAGDGSGGRRFDIVPGHADASIMVFRMETNNPAAMMPELGRAIAHDEGVALIREWIDEMEGNCA